MSQTALLSRSDPVSPEADGLGVALGSVDTPIGTLQLAATSQGLVRIGFGYMETRDDMMAELADLPCSMGQGDSDWLVEPITQLREYFDGSRRWFEVALDWRLSHGFYRQVQDALMTVEYGTTVSYGELAHMAGSPGAARAVGTAMSTNPIPLIVPCHRVVRSDGSVGEFGGRPEVKTWLIDHERAHRD
ncbi:MAG: methylated-DNA--[protein]-cysteine S-methyltransferase [bacterium]|nr:methylated-DNA--[protein]-cysteine S-methyltransferase [bacterium]MCY4135820.1 methylated-DNA--[protein]-cysteine S-methyltransferase [bacterium]